MLLDCPMDYGLAVQNRLLKHELKHVFKKGCPSQSRSCRMCVQTLQTVRIRFRLHLAPCTVSYRRSDVSCQ